jgi:glycogen(starch) synthase
VPSDVLVVTPWYPTAARPFYGGFVTGWVDALQTAGANPEVLHLDLVPDAAAVEVTETTTVGGARLTHVVVPQPPRASRADMARAQAAALRTLLPSRWPDVRTVHGHVTMPAGWALATTLPPGVRLVLTEHATYLNQLFRLPETRQMYAEAVLRSSACLAVSEQVAGMLRAAVPSGAGRIAALGNPVAFGRLPLLADRRAGLLRWLYVGNFIERKGLRRLLHSFAKASATERAAGQLTLTLVGDGPMKEQLEREAAALGVASRVTFRPGVPPERIGEIYADHDLLVHLATYETFGMTVIEAVASGLPAIVTRCGGPEETVLHAADLGAVHFVDVSNDASAVVEGWMRLAARGGAFDWQTVRTLLERRFAPGQVGAALRAHLGLGGSAANADVALSLKVLTLDHGTAREAAPAAALAADLGVHVSVATLPQGAGVRRIPARLRYGRNPRALTAAARAAVLAEPADLVAVDEFVGAALVGRGDGLPPVMSLSNRARLWQTIAAEVAS